MQTFSHTVLHATPQAMERATLAHMGQCAKQAADTWTFREWASRLATRAPPRDYIAQLKHLYNGVLERWRYVQEPEEWIHTSPNSLIGHVLGVKYNAPNADFARVDLARIPTREKGFGDCDDISTVVAAGVRALGMTPYFRVARGNGGAHVSVLARTPRGELVSIDPVGHPDHAFGWALNAPDIRLFGLDGNEAIPGFSGTQNFGNIGGNAMPCTMLTNYQGRPIRRTNLHVAAIPLGDFDGPRALAIPRRYMRMLARNNVVVDGCPAVDENGKGYRYDAKRDMWVHESMFHGPLAGIPDEFGGLGGRRERRRARRARVRARRKKRFAKVRKFVRRIVKGARKLVAKILNSRIAQGIISNVLRIYGVPARLTRGVMSAAANILEKGGIPALVRLLRKDKKAAMQLVAQAAKAGARAGMRLFGDVDSQGRTLYLGYDEGATQPYYAAPVIALGSVPGAMGFGDLEVTDEPEPGKWYRIQKGDALLTVAGEAYNVGAGGKRLKWAQAINSVKANAYAIDPSLGHKWWPQGRITFKPKFASNAQDAVKGAPGSSYAVIYIPLAPGDEPPVVEDQKPDIEPPIVPPVEPQDTTPVIPETETTTPEVEPEVEPPIEPKLPEVPETEEEIPPEVEPDVGPTIPPVETKPPEVETIPQVEPPIETEEPEVEPPIETKPPIIPIQPEIEPQIPSDTQTFLQKLLPVAALLYATGDLRIR